MFAYEVLSDISYQVIQSSTHYVVFNLDSGSQLPNSVGPSQEGMMGEVSGAGGGVGGSSSDTGMASNVTGRTLGSSDVGAASLTGLVGGVRPGEGGVGGAAVPGPAISAGIGTGVGYC